MPSFRLLVLLLVVVLTGLAPATYASPPDPTWVSGFWDDDDFDDVVLLLEGSVAVVPVLTVDPVPTRDIVAVVDDEKPVVVSATVDDTATPRAPPLTVSA